MIGKSKGDSVEVPAPGGTKQLRNPRAQIRLSRRRKPCVCADSLASFPRSGRNVHATLPCLSTGLPDRPGCSQPLPCDIFGELPEIPRFSGLFRA